MARRKDDVMAALSAPIMAQTAPAYTQAPTPAPEPSATPAPTEAKPAAPADDRVRLTVYLPPAVHNRLREIAFTKRIKQNDIVMAALDAHFTANGWPERCR